MDETVERSPGGHDDETKASDETLGGPPPSAGPPALPERYEARGPLGSGAMGSVVRAWDREVGREVAIKVLSGHDLNERQRERFRREGEVTARLEHPGIVRVHDMGLHGTKPYIVYELVDGETLADVLPRVSREERIRLLRDTAAALGHAHRAGVVHRDVKPSNVLVDGEGRVRVADFGLAAGRDLQPLTQTGVLLGTVCYMSPEQVRAERVGPASDVWALGVMLFEALTGELPFEGNFTEVAVAIVHRRPDRAKQRAPDVPDALDALCARCLEANAERRPADGAAFAAALDACATEEPRRSLPTATLAGVCGLALVLLAVVAWPRGSAPAPPVVRPDAPRTIERSAPPWFLALPSRRRPSLPLPEGLSFGSRSGDYVNAQDGSVLVYVPGGTYRIGNDRTLEEAPEHERVVEGFFLGKHEVTCEQFAAYRRATGKPPAEPEEVDGPQHPVRWVTFAEAQAYCRWAGLRLPREAEWEAAARGGDARLWPWGDTPPRRGGDRANVMGAPNRTTPVGSYPRGAAPCGALDLAGNVWEWVDDAPTPYGASGETEVLGDLAGKRVVRGGAFISVELDCRTHRRRVVDEGDVDGVVGFRVAR